MTRAEILAKKDEIIQAENKQLRDALEKIAKLGNGKYYGNSEGNIIAQFALGYKPCAVVKNTICNIEKMMGIYPNVPGMKGEVK